MSDPAAIICAIPFFPGMRDALHTAIRTADLQGSLTDEDCLDLADAALAALAVPPTDPAMDPVQIE